MTNLRSQHGMAAIQDDIIVYRKTGAEHEVSLQRVFKIIVESKLKLNEKKCEIRQPKLCYFGNIISEKGVSPDPKDVSKLRQLLGMINYLDKFLPNLSNVINP